MPVTGVILAGGRGTRIGGADKGLAEYDGRPLIEWMIERIRPQVDELLINANRNVDRYASYGLTVVGDLRDDYAGPLAGLQAAMAKAAHDWLLMVPCDTPALPRNLVSHLMSAATGAGAAIAVAQTQRGWHPAVALVRRSLAPDIDAFLESGQRRVRDWISQQSHVAVSFDVASDFANLNTPGELSRK
ncbi:MAG: molybdenum cofactor guanylyltransferase MobA [Burkholderiales bacterium]